MSLKALTQEIRNLTGTPIALTRGSSFTDKKAKKPKVLSHIPYRILDAPRLRNDFYSNLVAWSRMTGQVAVGLGIDVYIWTEYEGAVCLNIANRTSPVMSLAFSETNILMIGYKSGKILMFDINKNKVHARYNMIKNGVCCGLWSPGSSTTLFVGDEIGNVLCLRTTKNGTPPSGFISLEKVSILKAHQQQICGMAISPDNTQIAIGGNDNLCTVWDIRNISEPKLQYRLPHKAAVKALAFCPWSSALLATGGGSFDRTIRFWHTNSGTLLESLEVQGQVTSLVWSRHYRQIAATFGFSNPTQPKLVSVYSFPKCIPLVQVPATANLRVLSAVLSPDGVCICVASNDETIRFYELWATKDKKVPHVLDYPQSGMFGSDLIELEEGIDKNYDIVR
ncbi:WD40 repeat-like protein [Nadsonia fulvescens var. elongata DSM 6958]|uniref:WD40 repeat-like protein n=1 Tax=Nadsonia fulvescens var. elongata DSM 6958 TaxID=857566 RepID=A0A1E3PMH7_9ASCO|nr:WD40 repeat-like protein [Nadsonia fulvescens var. elongata DSM 6958]